MEWCAKWIKSDGDFGDDICPVFEKRFPLGKINSAKLYVTALGVYEAVLNGKRISDFVLAPGWTSYDHRLQYQEYDVTDMLSENNVLSVTVGKGWYRSSMAGWHDAPAGMIAELAIENDDGTKSIICTDESWGSYESQVRFSEIYHGETFDASFSADKKYAVIVFDGPYDTLIPQEGERIKEHERIFPAKIITTPKGETVMDFGQEVTGYVEIKLSAHKGELVKLSHAEVLDKEGNFYTANYRRAKAAYTYICRDGEQTYKPKLTFYGFRFIRIDSFPGGAQCAKLENFTAVAVYSDIRRTGYLTSGNALLNRFFENAVWGQKCNFLDVPTDCPQRDERLGWTGDAQVFARTACLNYNVEKFFSKWLADMKADQHENGMLDHVIPGVLKNSQSSAAWGDAAVICPWEVYSAYGNKELLKRQFPCMKKWVDYITQTTTTENLWTGGTHFGDWLGLDAPSGSYKGATRDDFIASAFYAHSTDIVVKAGHVLGQDVSEYESLSKRIHSAFRKTYNEFYTQTECVLAAHFALTDNIKLAADKLAEMIRSCGGHLQTGFVGTPYLLYVLSDNGYTSLAYDLLLRTEYPSWLYPVTKGATTVWEHWDGIAEDGSFWSSDMNSFNHYAYGAVMSWVYNVAAGITPLLPGYEEVAIAPKPDMRLQSLEARLDTSFGRILSKWEKQENYIRYEIITPVNAKITLCGKTYDAKPGEYLFFSDIAE